MSRLWRAGPDPRSARALPARVRGPRGRRDPRSPPTPALTTHP